METALYAAALLFSFYAGLIAVRAKPRRLPICTITLASVLAICLLLQVAFPSLLPLFERNAELARGGQLWRIGTALFFQDGGIAGGFSNILFLLFLGSIAEQVFSKRNWLFVYFGAGLAAECVALSWQPIGAGNSIAVFGLAGAICARTILKPNAAPSSFLSFASLACAAALLLHDDIHGAGFMAGLFLGAVIALSRTKKE